MVWLPRLTSPVYCGFAVLIIPFLLYNGMLGLAKLSLIHSFFILLWRVRVAPSCTLCLV